ncbi:MAG: hypothetical protein R3270_12010 [Gammaproteobacteria bacterium]|nr:hypothetical protein [Gammaproteobacteria bacterium]
MTQQVNLYQPILRQQKRVFSSETILLIVAGVGTVMLLLWAFNSWQLGVQRDRLVEVQAREAETAAKVAELTQQISRQEVSVELRQRVERLRAERELKDRLFQTLFAEDNEEGRFSGGFVPPLEALGRQRIGGLWLTRIAFTSSGRNVDLTGRTERAELVPQLVAELGEEEALSSLVFQKILVLQDGSRLSFELSTRPPESEDEEE